MVYVACGAHDYSEAGAIKSDAKVFGLAPTAQYSRSSLGQRPRYPGQRKFISAESAIQLRAQQFQEEYRDLWRKYRLNLANVVRRIETQARLIRAFSARFSIFLFLGRCPRLQMNHAPGAKHIHAKMHRTPKALPARDGQAVRNP